MVTLNTSTASVRNSSAANAMPSNLISRAFSSAASKANNSRRVRSSPTRLPATPNTDLRKPMGKERAGRRASGPAPLAASDQQAQQQAGHARDAKIGRAHV